ncbi:MAG: cytochrome c oxidase subunit II [Chloroherpetonaceae bacterium]|nr:cytochrome c oxidase subunit II [Chloroherpetonaceae bacterium]
MKSSYLPEQASTIASDIDSLIIFITNASAWLFLLVTIVSVYYLWIYRRKNERPEYTSGISHNTRLEIIWTLIPTLLVFLIFFWGFRSYLDMNVVPKDALEIRVLGKKWFWAFDYPNGANSVNELVVPQGKPLKFLISSEDVIHSFYVPAFRVKMDAVPNRYSILTATPTQAGTFDIFCTEYCGKSHSEMIGKIRVVSETEYNKWLEEAEGGGSMKPEEFGKKLYISKACVTCHSVDGTANTGPTWKGAYGKKHKLADGSEVLADENYLRESMLEPNAKVVAGYQPVMPTYQGILKQKQIDAIIAYMKTIQ